jgi:hypothetical protein
MHNFKVESKLNIRVNNGNGDIKSVSIPSNIKTLLVVYEDKSGGIYGLCGNTGITVGSQIILTDIANRYYTFTLYVNSDFYSWGRLKYTAKSRQLTLEDFGCNFYNSKEISKPWLTMYSM